MWNNIFINYLQSVVDKIIDYSYCTINPKACRFIVKLRRLSIIKIIHHLQFIDIHISSNWKQIQTEIQNFPWKISIIEIHIYLYRLILIQFLKNWNFSNFINNSKIIKQFLFKYAVLSIHIFSPYIISYNFR